MAKFNYIYDILIFLYSVWDDHILIYFFHLPANWVKNEKNEKCTENLVKYWPKTRLCSERYSFCLSDLKSDMRNGCSVNIWLIKSFHGRKCQENVLFSSQLRFLSLTFTTTYFFCLFQINLEIVIFFIYFLAGGHFWHWPFYISQIFCVHPLLMSDFRSDRQKE